MGILLDEVNAFPSVLLKINDEEQYHMEQHLQQLNYFEIHR